MAVCKHFLLGRCEYGAECRFAHTGSPVQSAASGHHIRPSSSRQTQLEAGQFGIEAREPRGDAVCRHFLQGKCEYGDACRFSHVADSSGVSPLIAEPRLPRVPDANGSLCRHFLQGKCEYGDNCNFSHGKAVASFRHASAVASVSASASICRHFVQGKCEYGDKCNFSHGETVVPMPVRRAWPSPVTQVTLPTQATGDACRHFLVGKCNYADCRFVHAMPEPEPVERSGELCRHFQEGKCTYGDQCRFSHGSVVSSYAPVRSGAIMPQQEPAGTLRAICRHFLAGRCTMGDACRFSHEGEAPLEDDENLSEPVATLQSNGKLQAICRHFLVGRCNMGDACRFSHEERAASEEVDDFSNLIASLDDVDPQTAVETEQGVCRHFLAGRCTYGDGCRFPHAGARQANQRSSPY
eukprot:TRINITY_DN28249_c0_g1_i1.p1 TRINITY_DN28249_c0_g1~~TRINITY_DN28249_c0_g1_i1.p1  ORF type:complete len:410 (+),score=47.26 TRINITY_DN28249_c0_g1_i1:109-1338(+)